VEWSPAVWCAAIRPFGGTAERAVEQAERHKPGSCLTGVAPLCLPNYGRSGGFDAPHREAELLVRRTADQGLLFAGWDFKVDSDGTYWCLECNPMPGYSRYDRVCDYTIIDALTALLRRR
jgi:hypothetical protein